MRELALALLLAGCGGPTLVAYQPVEQKTELAPEKLYAAAEGVLLDHGYNIKTRDAAAFRLETEERRIAGSDIKQDKYHYVWIVEAGSGALKIRIDCKRTSGADSEDCGSERPEKLVKEQDKLVQEILREAGGADAH
jgi:hypothetical protein